MGKSKADLDDLLRRSGASQTLMGRDGESGTLLLGFSLEHRQFRISVTLNAKGNTEQKERQAWRALLLLLRAKLEIVAMGQSTLEREFLANLVLPNGSTVGDDVLPKIARAYESGKMPNLLPSGAP